jgi:transcriptional regulator with XRE-family HTH domain
MESTVIKRIKDFLEHKNISQEDLRRALVIRSRSQVSNWFTGADNMPDKQIVKIIRAFPDLNANWLIRGEGEMLNDPQKMVAHIMRDTPFCTECIKKEGKLEYMQELLEEKDKRFDKVSQKVGELAAKLESCQEELEGGIHKANAG